MLLRQEISPGYSLPDKDKMPLELDMAGQSGD